MSATRAQLRDYAKDELGTDLASLISDDDFDRYINDAIRRLGYYLEETATLTWNSGDTSVALPADFVAEDRIQGAETVSLPRERRIWGNTMYFQVEGVDSDGSATLFYFAEHPALDDDADATALPGTADTALVAFVCYRAYKRIASSRADYRRYSTLVQANGVDVSELASISDQYYAEFLEAKEGLPSRQAATFYGD